MRGRLVRRSVEEEDEEEEGRRDLGMIVKTVVQDIQSDEEDQVTI